MGEKKTNKQLIDGLKKQQKAPMSLDLPLARFINKNKNASVLFAKNGRTSRFFTNDSKRYITPSEYRQLERGERLARTTNRFDSLLSRNFEKNKIHSIKYKDLQYLYIKERYSSLGNYISDLARGSVQGVSMARMWNLSIVGAVIFGMFTMTMIYRYLGQGVSAAVQERVAINQEQDFEPVYSSGSNVIDFDETGEELKRDIDTKFITNLLEEEKDLDNQAFEKELHEMLRGYPMEKMIPEIIKQDRIVAAFIVAIGKKESNWGKRVPVLDGQDCLNYWGYRGIRKRMGTGGHTCFDSTKDAVDTVAKRIGFLVSNKKLNTPSKMVIWKCGSNCGVTGGQAAADKWIKDVAMYFDKLNKKDQDKNK